MANLKKSYVPLCFFFFFALFPLASWCPCRVAAVSSTIYIPIPANDGAANSSTIIIQRYTTGFPRGAHAVHATGQQQLRVVIPPPDMAGLARVTTQAAQSRCQVAVNGGPFHADGTSVGVLIINGTVVTQQQQESTNTESLVGVGRTQGNTNTSKASSWVLGAPPPSFDDLDFFVTGFGWLVRDGTNVAPREEDEDEDTTGAVRAPRTAVGVTAAGHLVFVVADGCERCWHIRGLTLHELGQQLIDQVGLVQAINLDGGSSSVLVEHRDDGRRSSSSTMRIVNHPTCLDYVSLKCERPVATVFCLGQYIENDDDGHKAMRGSSSSSPDFVVYVVP
mmetsp:Transcript_17654/g.33483  ORF Transcript_17654/g.33483 Transcript_17654/m.33483 type:complete len:335 (+) Transcript_17654:103-1107(+)|eukprot:scaffold1555_cov173-Amphora_coffeaeformis.AAC.9